jgi:hypothetical protein
MKQYINIIILFFCINTICINAQVDSVYNGLPNTNAKKKDKIKGNQEWRERIFYGGFVLPGFYNGAFYLTATPNIGYRITDNFSAGVGLNYNYSRVRYSGIVYEQSLYGANVFIRYIVSQNIYIQAQYERLNQPNYYSYNTKDRTWVEYLLLGAGYRQPLGDHASLVSSIMFNVLPNRLSVYQNPIFQIGIQAGF